MLSGLYYKLYLSHTSELYMGGEFTVTRRVIRSTDGGGGRGGHLKFRNNKHTTLKIYNYTD